MSRSLYLPFCLVLSLFLGADLLQAAPSKMTWQLKRQLADLVIWEHRDSKNLRASSQWKEGPGKLIQQKDITSFVEKLEAKKTQGLNLTGVKNWKVDATDWDKNSKVLTLRGSYHDRKDNRVEFVELHCFEENSRSIHLITSKKGEAINEDEVDSLLTRARTLGSSE